MNKFGVAVLTFCTSCLFVSVNAAEPEDFRQGLALEYFNKIDVNQNQTIDRSELNAFVDQMFTEMDTNGDGEATKDEIKAHRKNMNFAMLDTNNDGYISEEELKATGFKRKRIFSKADSNDDGLLSKEELAELQEKRR